MSNPVVKSMHAESKDSAGLATEEAPIKPVKAVIGGPNSENQDQRADFNVRHSLSHHAASNKEKATSASEPHGSNNEEFRVRWDGDDDSFNPRRMNNARKWIIVLIVSGSSFCVYASSVHISAPTVSDITLGPARPRSMPRPMGRSQSSFSVLRL